jgi:hypothetical protein
MSPFAPRTALFRLRSTALATSEDLSSTDLLTQDKRIFAAEEIAVGRKCGDANRRNDRGDQ